MKGALSFVSIVWICIGFNFISNSVDASDKNHLAAFAWLGQAIILIWGGIFLFLFEVLRIPLP